MNETLIKMTELLDRIRHETGADQVEARNSHMADLIISIRWGAERYSYAYSTTELMSAKVDLIDGFIQHAKKVRKGHFAYDDD